MHTTLLIARLLHIILGVFWGGTMYFTALFLEPSAREAGPAAGPVMQGLLKRNYFAFLPLFAVVTLLSGFTLLWIDSSGFSSAFMGSSRGIAYSAGALFALFALGIGLMVLRPATMAMFALGAQMAQLPADAPREALMAEVGQLRNKVKVGARWVATLLLLTVAIMAVARYVD